MQEVHFAQTEPQRLLKQVQQVEHTLHLSEWLLMLQLET